MKRFAFRFQRVLEWRQGLLSLEEAQLQALFAELQQLEQEQLHLRQALDATRHDAVNSSSLQGDELRALSSYHLKVRRSEIEIRLKLQNCQTRISQQQLACSVARRHVKLLETLRDRKKSVWNQELDKELAQLAEESFTAKWVTS